MIIRTQVSIIGYKQGIFQHGFHHRMATIGDGDFLPQGNFRTAVSPLHRYAGQTAQSIGSSHRGGSLLYPGGLLGQVFPQLGENLVFQGSQPIFGSEHLGFQFFEFLGDVALAVCQCLLADVMLRHLIHKGFGYFNIVAENPVISHFQGADAGFLPFGSFHSGNGAAAAFHNIPQPVGFFAGTFADDAAFPDGQGRIFHNGGLNQIGTVCQSVHALLQFPQQRCLGTLQLPLHFRQSPEAPGQSQQIPAIYRTGNNPGHHPFQIGNVGQCLFQFSPDDGVVRQFFHSAVAAGNLHRVQQRLFQPGAQQPPAHGGVGFIQHPQQGSFFLFGTHGFRQFQIPPGVQIQFHELSGGIVLQLADVGQIIFLQRQQGLQQCTAGNHGSGQSYQPQLGQRCLEMAFQQTFRLFQPEQFCLTFVHTAV